MKITKTEQLFYVDVDKTLVFDCLKYHPDSIETDYYGQLKYVRPHKKHVEFVKSLKERGYYVIVHSANGWKWAKEIVEKLKLETYIHEVKPKGIKYLDDMCASKWMGVRVYIPEGEENV